MLILGPSNSGLKKLINIQKCPSSTKLDHCGAQVLAVWSQTDLQPLKQNLCLAPDQKMVRPKKVANDLKINLAP